MGIRLERRKSKRTVRKLVDSSYTLGGPVDAKILAIAEGTEIKQTTLGTEKYKVLWILI